MRLKLLRRRLTVSAPRVAIRSAMPWPLRWIVLAVFFGLCAAIALWAFEFGKSIAGLDSRSRDELLRLREEVSRLREENRARDEASSAEGSPAHRRAHGAGARDGAHAATGGRQPHAARRPGFLRKADSRRQGPMA